MDFRLVVIFCRHLCSNFDQHERVKKQNHEALQVEPSLFMKNDGKNAPNRGRIATLKKRRDSPETVFLTRKWLLFEAPVCDGQKNRLVYDHRKTQTHGRIFAT